MLLRDHFRDQERLLLARSAVPANSGHGLHKGTPREAFVKEFLSSHVADLIAIGTGEIIDTTSKANELRSQMDVVLYSRAYPKIDFGGGISGFLAESVVATVEVKSTLDEEGLANAVHASHLLKRLRRGGGSGFQMGWIPPNILSFVVAYDGPAKMGTVRSWLARAHVAQSIPTPNLPSSQAERLKTAGPSLDGVFVLGKGFVTHDSLPTLTPPDGLRAQRPDGRWIVADTPENNLLVLFLVLTAAISGSVLSSTDPSNYVTGLSFGSASLEP